MTMSDEMQEPDYVAALEVLTVASERAKIVAWLLEAKTPELDAIANSIESGEHDGHTGESVMMRGFDAGLEAGFSEGQKAERAAIVEWLCNYAVLLQNPDYRGIARKIERGEHLRGNDE